MLVSIPLYKYSTVIFCSVIDEHSNFLQPFLITEYYFACPCPSKHEKCPISLDLLSYNHIFNVLNASFSSVTDLSLHTCVLPDRVRLGCSLVCLVCSTSWGFFGFSYHCSVTKLKEEGLKVCCAKFSFVALA